MLLRLSTILLTILVLIGSVGLPVNRHFCMGELKSVAIFGEAKKCHQDQTRKQCPFHPTPKEEVEEKKKGCCNDEHELIQIDDQEQTLVDILPTIAAVLSDVPPLLINSLPPYPRPRKSTKFRNYRPPPLIPDVIREFQVFRI